MQTKSDEQTILYLFREIAAVEHLLRNHYDRAAPAGMTAGQFGVLSYFIRTGKSEERLSILAWVFQDEDAYMAEKVATLVQRGLLSTVPSDRDAGDLMVAITDQGRESHAQAIDEIRPDVEQLLEGISMDDVRTTLKVVQDIRRTLDHMPGR
ncbi:MAG: hypothetical protein RIR59_1210 [Pseudomonadota bacterium]|jgi:DNA-binding MarR family transcriptional regulator